MSQDTPSPRPTFVRTAIVVGAAVIAALGGGYAIAANSPTPRQVVTPPAAPSDFVGIQPVRVLDTRGAAGGPIGVPAAAKLSAGQTIDVAVGGVGAIPKDAVSVAVNITIDEDATLKSFLTVWPAGETRPNTSANNAEPGLVSPNSAIFQLGTDGKLSVFNQQGTVNVIMDVTGYFVEDTGGGTTTTTTPGQTTTTTTIAPAEPTLTLRAGTYEPDDVILFDGAGWSDCGTSVNILLDGAATAKVVGIEPDGTFQSSKLISGLSAADNPHTLGAESADAGFTCAAEANFDITAP